MENPNQGTMGGATPTLNVLGQYVKDLSFENPNAPNLALRPDVPPTISVQVNVDAKPMSETDFEVEIAIEGRAEFDNSVLFRVDLVYAGIFRIQNVPRENLQPIVLIECPRLLFPFARQVVADTVRDGGFPPLMIDPVDFVSLYRQRIAGASGMQGQAAN